MNQPTVSVIIPVYNGEKFLKQCMESILNQSLKEIEVICVNDGSTDRSLEILEQYESNDKRVKVLSQENISAGAARNRGLLIAKGKYLSFLDADDFFEVDMLKEAYGKAEDTGADIVVYRSDRFDEKRRQFTATNWTIKREYLPDKDVFSHKDMYNIYGCFMGWTWDKLFKSEMIRQNDIVFQDQKSINDLAFVFCALSKAERIAVLDNVYAHKRHNVENAITTNYRRKANWHYFYQALMALKQQLAEWQIYDELRQDFVNYALYFSLWNLKKFVGIEDYKVFYKTLKEQWLQELDVLGQEETYFYERSHYQRLVKLLDLDEEQWLDYQAWTGKDGTYLFPFAAVPKGAKIVLYGAGNVGHIFYRQVIFSGFCQVVEWVDTDYETKGMLVKNPDEIGKKKFDYIVVAINDPYVAEAIMNDLAERNIERERIIWKAPEIDIREI